MIRTRLAALLAVGCFVGCSGEPGDGDGDQSNDALSAGDALYAASWSAVPGGSVGVDSYRTFPISGGGTVLLARTNVTNDPNADGGGSVTRFDSTGRVVSTVAFTTQFIPIHAFLDGNGDLVFVGTPSLKIPAQVPSSFRSFVEVTPNVRVARDCVTTILGKINPDGKIPWIRSIESSYSGAAGRQCDTVVEPRLMPLPTGEIALVASQSHPATQPARSRLVLGGYDGEHPSKQMDIDGASGLYRFGDDGTFKMRIDWTGLRQFFWPLPTLGGVLGSANTTRADGVKVFSMIRTLPTGYVMWKREVPAASFSIVATRADASGNTYAVGTFSEKQMTIDSQTLPHTPDDPGSDGFVAKFDTLGKLAYLKSIWGNGSQTPVGLALDPGGVVHVWGTYNGEAVAGTRRVQQAGVKRHMFLAGIDATGNWMYANTFGDANSTDGASSVEASADGLVVTGGADLPFGLGRTVMAQQPGYGTPILAPSLPAGNVIYQLPPPSSRRPGFNFIAKIKLQ